MNNYSFNSKDHKIKDSNLTFNKEIENVDATFEQQI